MTNQELIRLLKANSYKRIALDNDTGEPKTFYTYRRGLHINATDKLSFHIVPQSQSLGLGRFAICATGNGASSQVGTDCPELFFPRLLSYLKGETSGEEIIRYVTGFVNSADNAAAFVFPFKIRHINSPAFPKLLPGRNAQTVPQNDNRLW